MHGSMIITSNGRVYQEIGIPSPPGLVPVIPKYIVCGSGSWGRSGVSMCRVLSRYSPRGLMDAADRAGLGLRIDPLYMARIPYIQEASIMERVTPPSALERVAKKPRGRISMMLVEIVSALRPWGLGITGTIALGIENDRISDIDLIVATWTPSRFMGLFRETTSTFRRRPELAWRRGYYMGVHVSWTGVPPIPAGHCRPLKNYWNVDTPRRRARIEVYVEPGQEGALLYPPCVEAEGLYLVSYQYNHGYTLYRGGRLMVEGVIGEYTVYTGVGEAPTGPSPL